MWSTLHPISVMLLDLTISNKNTLHHPTWFFWADFPLHFIAGMYFTADNTMNSFFGVVMVGFIRRGWTGMWGSVGLTFSSVYVWSEPEL